MLTKTKLFLFLIITNSLQVMIASQTNSIIDPKNLPQKGDLITLLQEKRGNRYNTLTGRPVAYTKEMPGEKINQIISQEKAPEKYKNLLQKKAPQLLITERVFNNLKPENWYPKEITDNGENTYPCNWPKTVRDIAPKKKFTDNLSNGQALGLLVENGHADLEKLISDKNKENFISNQKRPGAPLKNSPTTKRQKSSPSKVNSRTIQVTTSTKRPKKTLINIIPKKKTSSIKRSSASFNKKTTTAKPSYKEPSLKNDEIIKKMSEALSIPNWIDIEKTPDELWIPHWMDRKLFFNMYPIHKFKP